MTLTQAISSAPEAARALREFLAERVWAHRRGDTAPAARTAALVSSQLLGTAWAGSAQTRISRNPGPAEG